MGIDKRRLKEYIRQMQDLQGRLTDEHFIDRFQEKLLDLLSRNQIDTDDITFIRNEVERIFKPEFAGFDTKVKKTYNDVLEVVNELYDDIGTDMSRKFSKLRAVEQTNRLQLGEYELSTIESIARKIRQGIVDDVNYKDLARDIKQIGGKAAQYADTLAQTQIKRYGRVSKYNKSLIANVEVFEYAGVLRETTRPFCRACLHQLFHISNILQMKNGNLEPVIINCGGWNCIHDWEPDPTASKADAVSGKYYSLPRGARIYGDSGISKIFSYSIGLENLGGRRGIQDYIDKTRKLGIKDRRIRHIRRHYPDLSDQAIRAKVGYIRNNAQNMYYQYNEGPGIVFEYNGEFLKISASKVKTMFKPPDLEKYRKYQSDYFVRLTDYE